MGHNGELKFLENDYTLIEYNVYIIYISIYIYMFLFCFFMNILFVFEQKKFSTLSDLKLFSKLGFITTSVILVILSMAGMPPLLGFIGKFLIFIFLLILQKHTFILMFTVLIIFSIYFYIQNLRFLVNQTLTNFLPKKGFFSYLNTKLINSLVIFNYVNLLAIFYIEDILYYFNNIVFYKNIF